MILSKAQILGAQDIRTEQVAVPEWGGDVIVRGLSGLERDRFESGSVTFKGGKAETKFENIRARLVAACVVDETGARLFSDQDAQALGEKSGAALDRIFSVAQRLSGLTDNDIEEISKN